MSDSATEILDLLDRCKPSLRQLLEELVQGQRDFLRVQQNILHLLKVLTENNGIIIQNQEKTMAAVDDLVTQVAALKDELTALKTSNDALVAAIENWIATHQNSDDPKVVQAVADLQQAVTDAKAVQATDDAETTKLSGQ